MTSGATTCISGSLTACTLTSPSSPPAQQRLDQQLSGSDGGDAQLGGDALEAYLDFSSSDVCNLFADLGY